MPPLGFLQERYFRPIQMDGGKSPFGQLLFLSIAHLLLTRVATEPIVRTMFWDNVKGAAILAVVLIHASDPMLAEPSGSLTWVLGLMLDQILDFAVPLFLAVSGFFARYDHNDTPLRYYTHRFKRILGPYILWTLVYLAVFRPADLVPPYHLIIALVTGAGIGIGYFVVVLCQWIVLTPLMARIRSQQTHLVLIVVTSGLGLLYSYIVRLDPNGGVLGQFPAYALPFFVWSPFYQLGFYLQRFPHGGTVIARYAPLAAAAFLGLSMAEGLLISQHGNVVFGASQIKFTSFAYSVALITWLVARSKTDRWSIKILSWCGRHSYSIYLMHMLVLRGLNRFLIKVPAFNGLVLFKVALSATLVLAVCSAFIWSWQYVLIWQGSQATSRTV